MNAQEMLKEQQKSLFKSRSHKDNYTDPVKVGIYGRVSTEHDAQVAAFANQLDWYELVLKQHPNWEVYDIYSDKASGTNTKRRKDFNRMIEDALAGKFQLLITREVCRFARNTVDSLSYTRLLDSHNCEVYFVNDNIWSRDSDGELRLTIFAALAQDEARKTSERCRAGQLISREKAVLYGHNAFGYRHIKGDKSTDTRYVADFEEADTVKRIYELYLAGNGLKAIAGILTAEGRKNKSGVVKFDATQISRVLSNKIYCGYVAYNKSTKEDFLKKRKVNRDTSTHIYIKAPDKVEPIISEEDFNKVQEIKLGRKRKETGRVQCKRESHEKYIRKLKCGCCGKTFKKYLWRKLADGSEIYGYQCRSVADYHSNLKGDNEPGYCNIPSIAQWKLDFMLSEIVKEIWDSPKDTVKKLMELVSEAYSDTGEAEEQGKRIEVLNTEIAKVEARKTTLEMKWLDEKLTDADHDRLCGVLDESITKYKAEVKALEELLNQRPDNDLDEKMNTIRIIEGILLEGENLTNIKINDLFIDSFVARIVPCEGRVFKWYLNIGTGKGWALFSEDAYELYDYWTLGYESANRYRKSFNKYLRKNQWEDLHVEVYIRTQ